MKKGISLVALVVTIIVLIILTGAVVATFMEGGIIDKAKDAVKKSDLATLQEAYNLAYSVEKIDVETGTGGEVSVVRALGKAVKQVGMEDTIIINGQLVEYKGSNNYIEDWLATLGLGSATEEQAEFANIIIENGFLYNNGYITGIKTDGEKNEVDYGDQSITTLEQLVGEENLNMYEVRNNSKNTTEYLTTGDEIIEKETGNVVGTVIVYGDLNGDRIYDVFDLVYLANRNDDPSKLSEIARRAMDINCDGYITTEDWSYIMIEETAEVLGINTSKNMQMQISKNNIQIGEIVLKDEQYSIFIDNLSKKYEILETQLDGADVIEITLDEEVTLGEFKKIMQENMFKYAFIQEKINLWVGSSDYETVIINTNDLNETIPNNNEYLNWVTFKYGNSKGSVIKTIEMIIKYK